MIRAALFLALTAAASAAPAPSFFRALHQVETSGRHGPILGDSGKALGPLQIHRACWKDSKVSGRYEQVADFAYASKVASAYLKRHAPAAWARGDVVTLARVWNGGPSGHRKTATLAYAARVKRAMAASK